MQKPLTGFHISEHQTKTNARLKKYPGKTILQVCNTNLFPTGKFEPENEHLYICTFNNDHVPSAKEPTKSDIERSQYESHRRAVSSIRDITLCNKFEYMLTWTLSGVEIDRYDAKVIYRKVKTFLSHMVQRKKFSYLIVPEYHKQKKDETRPAIHMHGLCCIGNVHLTFSGLCDKDGREIYNMDDWKYGYSTCVPLDDDYTQAVKYITKYISKSSDKIFGKYYLSSRNLIKHPQIIPLPYLDFDDFRDDEKLFEGLQHETSVYRDIKIVSEIIEGDNIS